MPAGAASDPRIEVCCAVGCSSPGSAPVASLVARGVARRHLVPGAKAGVTCPLRAVRRCVWWCLVGPIRLGKLCCCGRARADRARARRRVGGSCAMSAAPLGRARWAVAADALLGSGRRGMVAPSARRGRCVEQQRHCRGATRTSCVTAAVARPLQGGDEPTAACPRAAHERASSSSASGVATASAVALPPLPPPLAAATRAPQRASEP